MPGTERIVELKSIGEFALRSRLSQKALRLYDELGLLVPAQVDPDSGYRFYDPRQLEDARLVAALRRIGVPLAEVKVIIGLEPQVAADRIGEFWAGLEAGHAERRELANFLVERLSGKRSVMYEVKIRDIPKRSLLCMKRHVDGWDGAWAFGKEFVGILKQSKLPSLKGIEGAVFSIYFGEVSEDGDGPIEWCKPVPEVRADDLALDHPELTLRTEPAHSEAFIHLGRGGETTSVQWQLISEGLHSWSAEENRLPSSLGVRMTYLAEGPRAPDIAPDCDFAVPLL
jgi:DNA-binding transcriptional MerR regulator